MGEQKNSELKGEMQGELPPVLEEPNNEEVAVSFKRVSAEL